MSKTESLTEGIDDFKKLALKRLTKEPHRTYPISSRDLVNLDNCPLCNSKDLEVISRVYLAAGLEFFTTAICKQCAFTFRTVSPSIYWFQRCWQSIATGKLEVFNKGAEYYKGRRYNVYADMLKSYASKSRDLLEIGASYGTGSAILKKNGFHVEAIEAEESKANYLRDKLEIKVVGNTVESFLDDCCRNIYTNVVFSNCLEHLDDPGVVMRNMRKIVRFGGLLLLAVPNIWTCLTWSDALYLTHKSNFTLQNILSLITESGFELLEMRTVPFFFPNDNTDEIAFILRATRSPAPLMFSNQKKADAQILNRIKKLYFKNLPVESPSSLRFVVPHIDQFFQTLNLGSKNISLARKGRSLNFTCTEN